LQLGVVTLPVQADDLTAPRVAETTFGVKPDLGVDEPIVVALKQLEGWGSALLRIAAGTLATIGEEIALG